MGRGAAMTQISKTDTQHAGIRELTNEEIAAVAGGNLSSALQAIECKVARIISCITSLLCNRNQTV
jgi:hypothetical protein